MYKIRIVGFAILVFLLEACSSVSSIQQEIKSTMNSQQKAWNAGDLVGFMNGYWESDSLRFLGKDGVTLGWKSSLERYQRSYPSREKMGTLRFDDLRIEVLNGKDAYVDGRWNLFRSSDTLSGHFTLLWKRINGRWVIVSDHSS
jgi:ketosteroid isomerase-like protein